MISFFKSWTEQIVIAVIIVSLFDLILPKGYLKKYIKVILGLYIVFCMVSPFIKNKNIYNLEDIDLENYVGNITKTEETSTSESSIDIRLEQLYIEELEDDVEKKVKENGYEVYKCKVDADLKSSSQNPGIHKIDLVITEKKGIESVEINIGNDQPENQNDEKIENLKEVLASYYEVEKDIIKVKLKK